MSSSSTSNDLSEFDQESWEFEFLVESHYDHAGIWEAVIMARDKDRWVTRKRILLGLRHLMELDLIEAGYPTPDGKGFEPMTGSPEMIIKWIEREWVKLGHDPYLGDIVWFIATPKGDRVVRASGK